MNNLIYLRKLGDLVYFDDRDLCIHIFLDHNWLMKGMYYILSDNQIQKAKGRFTRQQAYQQWDSCGYNEKQKNMLLHLLLKDKFDICYELENERNVFITPLLLPNDKPEEWKHETNLYFRYQYGFIPHGLVSRLIVRVHEKIDGEQRWKTGVMLFDSFLCKTVRAEVQQFTDPDKNQEVIDIKINGGKEGCKHLLTFVRTAIEDLHKDFKNISFSRIVACNCDTCRLLMKKGEKPSFYDYKKLQRKIQNRSYSEECEKSNYKSVNIGQILNDVVLENAGKDNPDSELLYKLKEIGMSINQININNKNEANPIIKVDMAIDVKVTNTVSVAIQNMLGETAMLKEDIEDERKLLQKAIDSDEIDVTIRAVEKAEEAMKKIEAAQRQNQQPAQASRSRLKRFMDDLQNENSTIHKVLKLLRKGRDYGVSIAETYNKVAENIGTPLVSPLALDVIRKL